MNEATTMMQFSQLVFRSAFEKLMPDIMKMREEGKTEEEFHEELVPKVESLAEAIYNTMSEEDIASLMPEIFQATSLHFIVEKPKFEKFIKQNKRDEFKARVFAGFTTSALLMALNQIFEWGAKAAAEDTTDSQGQEPEEPVIS